MTNTHFVDDDVAADDEDTRTDETSEWDLAPPRRTDRPRAWPLEALATAPNRPLEALPPLPRQRRYRSVYPHEERAAPLSPATTAGVDARDERAWG